MEWFEDETLWRELYPYVFPADRVAAAPAQVSQILSLAAVTEEARYWICAAVRDAIPWSSRAAALP